MTRYGDTKKSLRAEKLAPKKELGQNFLVHKRTAEAVANCGKIKKDDIIIDINQPVNYIPLLLTGTIKILREDNLNAKISEFIFFFPTKLYY